MKPCFVKEKVPDLSDFAELIDRLVERVPAEGSAFDIHDMLLKLVSITPPRVILSS